MALKQGTINIVDAKIGTTQVKKMYLGNILIWQQPVQSVSNNSQTQTPNSKS